MRDIDTAYPAWHDVPKPCPVAGQLHVHVPPTGAVDNCPRSAKGSAVFYPCFKLSSAWTSPYLVLLLAVAHVETTWCCVILAREMVFVGKARQRVRTQ